MYVQNLVCLLISAESGRPVARKIHDIVKSYSDMVTVDIEKGTWTTKFDRFMGRPMHVTEIKIGDVCPKDARAQMDGEVLHIIFNGRNMRHVTRMLMHVQELARQENRNIPDPHDLPEFADRDIDDNRLYLG